MRSGKAGTAGAFIVSGALFFPRGAGRMRVDLFDFPLPPERIALRPAEPRDSARLLLVGPDGLEDRHILDLPGLLRAGDVLVFNDTRVIPAQLEGRRGEARIGATLHKREGPREWRAFVRNARRVRAGDRIDFGHNVAASVLAKGEDVLLAFEGDEPVELLLERAGRMPLPPYIAGRREADARDADDYQTMFAREQGAVAAPTAALHFTPRLMEKLAEAGIGHETLTLHVGAGTFLPVKAEDTQDHVMHGEWGRIEPAAAERLNAARAKGGRIVAVGTTSLRLLESAAGEDGRIGAFEGDTAIFITPGYKFRAIDGLLTNFHLPRSTLFMLVSALMGREHMLGAYEHAVAAGYRFYSYGDASLLLLDRQPPLGSRPYSGETLLRAR
jgi:S-adenosylmethionine:tRNA ribosyltransferase-isomerase